MIFPTYRAFRHGFALGGASTDATDGMPEFPGTAKLRTGGFSGTRKRDYAGVAKITMHLPF